MLTVVALRNILPPLAPHGVAIPVGMHVQGDDAQFLLDSPLASKRVVAVPDDAIHPDVLEAHADVRAAQDAAKQAAADAAAQKASAEAEAVSTPAAPVAIASPAPEPVKVVAPRNFSVSTSDANPPEHEGAS